jgi:outer membrane protein TolC
VKHILCLAAGLLCGSAWAAPPAPLHEALNLAWERAQAATDLAGAQRRADADSATAQRWWAGPASLSYAEQRGRQGRSAREQELALALPLWGLGQRSAHAALAAARQELLSAQRDEARLQLASALREAAWAVASRQAEREQALAQRDSLRALSADVARRVSAGDLARTDAQAAEAEALNATVALARQDLALQQALGEWQALLGPASPPPTPQPEAARDTAPAEHPALRVAELRWQAARREVERAHASRRDPAELSIGVRQVEGQAERQTLLSLRLPLERNPERTAQEADALAAAASAERQLSLLREQLALQQASATAALHHAEQQAEATQARAALLAERAQLIERAFRAGEADLPELLRALAASATAASDARQHALQLGLARARLNQSFGVLP